MLQMSGASEPGAPGSVTYILEDDSPSVGGVVGHEGRPHDGIEPSRPRRDIHTLSCTRECCHAHDA